MLVARQLVGDLLQVQLVLIVEVVLELVELLILLLTLHQTHLAVRQLDRVVLLLPAAHVLRVLPLLQLLND